MPDRAEFVDDHRRVAKPRIGEQPVEQRGLARAEKAGQHRDRDALGLRCVRHDASVPRGRPGATPSPPTSRPAAQIRASARGRRRGRRRGRAAAPGTGRARARGRHPADRAFRCASAPPSITVSISFGSNCGSAKTQAMSSRSIRVANLGHPRCTGRFGVVQRDRRRRRGGRTVLEVLVGVVKDEKAAAAQRRQPCVDLRGQRIHLRVESRGVGGVGRARSPDRSRTAFGHRRRAIAAAFARVEPDVRVGAGRVPATLGRRDRAVVIAVAP